MGADATRCRETVRALAGTWLPPAKTQGHNLRVTIEIGLGEVAPRAESECEGLDRDFLLAPCPTAIVLDSIAVVKPNRQTNPSTTERVSTETSRRPDLRRSRDEQEFKIGIEWERFGEEDNTLWTNHPELSGVCERGWNERIGKHSLATTNLSHPLIPFTCIWAQPRW
jgi:hypothetical protein